MVLLVILGVGLLTLSSVALRSSAGGLDLARARANARVAMSLAIAELQKQAGNDTRITARADVLNEKHPPVLGVWKSWEGTNHESKGNFAGRPISPGNYDAAKKARFLAWLTSVPAKSATPPDTSLAARKVALVGTGSVGKEPGRAKLQVHLEPTLLEGKQVKGALAWWIGGENQKARLPQPNEPDDNSAGSWAAQAKAHTVADPHPFRLDRLLDEPKLAPRAVSLRQADLCGDPSGRLSVSRDFFYDLSTVSVGLLTNSATGGWRKDFSLLTENWATLPRSNNPFFRVMPGKDIGYNTPASGGSYRPDKSLFYPWSGYRGGNNIPIYEHGAVSSWANLQNWATLYKGMAASSGATSIATHSVRIDVNDASGNYNYLHRVRIIPIVARVQWVFSHSAAMVSQSEYEPRLLVTPVVTLWNPYNVTIKSASVIRFDLVGSLPNAFRFSVGGVQNQKYNSITASQNNLPSLDTGSVLYFQINQPYTFKPGETLLFSPVATAVPVGSVANLTPGFRKQGGHYFPLKRDDGTTFRLKSSAVVSADAKFNSVYDDFGALGVGIYLDMSLPESGGNTLYRHLAYRMIYEPNVAEQVYKAIGGLAPASVAESISDPKPFLTTVFGARTASTTHLAAKGFVQSSPLVNYTAMGSKDTVETTIQWDYPGTAHPVNSPFDYSFERLAGAGDSLMPGTDSANRGFIITGFQSADGLSRCIIDELPTRPVQSLAELQHWDLRFENAIPPYAFNIIGNSDATPLIPANAVFNSSNSSKGPQDLQHDDFYCANHLLFDDWFVSSIAPNPRGFGKPVGSETLRKTFTDFVSGEAPLPNRAYHPIPADVSAARVSGGSEELFRKYASRPDAWRSIASRLEVEGMFNVNSTSVTAWRALLGHARRQRSPYFTAAGVTVSEAEDHAFSRMSIAGDSEARTRGSSGGFSSAAEFAGYRILNDKALDRLAEEVVKQVRARGPFLSLAEFVNRQLSSGDLALAGTIQAALNVLAADASVNPFRVLQGGSKASVASPPAAGNAGYRFPAAAIGYNAYGLPGWTRQADVLRPIAPVLTVRDDTFTIRAYGDARDGTGKIIAHATCEAVVRRVRDYVDPQDAAEITTLPKSSLNLIFGRRFEIVSFHWLGDGEV